MVSLPMANNYSWARPCIPIGYGIETILFLAVKLWVSKDEGCDVLEPKFTTVWKLGVALSSVQLCKQICSEEYLMSPGVVDVLAM